MSSLAVQPIDQIAIAEHLSGVRGRNRAAGTPQIAASDDRSAVHAWLARYADSPATLASYRKESERLLLWCLLQRRVALSDLTHEDLLMYRHFLGDPQPHERWVMAPGQKPQRSSPRWRPFAGPLSVASQRQAMSILNAMFSWLVEAGYLAGNPLALSRRPRRTAAPRVTRFLPMEHWDAVKATIEAMPTATVRQAAQAARTRWLFSLLYIGALRASEISTTRMSGFFQRRSGGGGPVRWWLEVTGKGDKIRLVPVTAEWLAELMRYRRAMSWSPLPREDDDTPLLTSLIGPVKPMARSAIHEIVKGVMRETAARLRAQGEEFEATAAHIEQASTHWLRHTAGSHLSEKADLKIVRDNLGHANLTTTSIYLHTEDDARHEATQQAHRVGWRSP
ncbi:tyrosine-type recombinase/integrase [Variovorax sp. ZS18.2.2]|uniref:tyrosine-type recombinase/integrase n=1 Tax=Variovorax sp. ZS18.2.2 TaxID=2971255 RepID=UPI002151ECE5|nr:tyrosine-type recombinase/integrase [Variovorax sp. ZS18.2.2]MCR6475968.1 tyrosine-type recombinase/integrase [Variovorax sp. ZS18.2.2]